MRTWLAVALGFVAAGCGENDTGTLATESDLKVLEPQRSKPRVEPTVDRPSHIRQVASTPREPELVVEQRELDVGWMEVLLMARVVFRLENRGGAPLRVLGVRADPDDWKSTLDVGSRTDLISPGAEGLLAVQLTPMWVGHHERRLVLTTNDPREPEVQLTVRARAAAETCWMVPDARALSLGRAQLGQPAYAIVLRHQLPYPCYGDTVPSTLPTCPFRARHVPARARTSLPQLERRPLLVEVDPREEGPLRCDFLVAGLELRGETTAFTLTGTASESWLEPRPGVVEFPYVRSTSGPLTSSLTIVNPTAVRAAVHELVMEGPSDALELAWAGSSTPITIEPGGSIELEITLNPEARSSEIGWVRVDVEMDGVRDALIVPVLAEVF